MRWSAYLVTGWHKLRKRTNSVHQKVLSPNIRYFVTISRFTHFIKLNTQENQKQYSHVFAILVICAKTTLFLSRISKYGLSIYYLI